MPTATPRRPSIPLYRLVATIPVIDDQKTCYTPKTAARIALTGLDRREGKRATAIWLSACGHILGGHALGDRLHVGPFDAERLILPLQTAGITSAAIVHPHRPGVLLATADDFKALARVLPHLCRAGVRLHDFVIATEAGAVRSLAHLIPRGQALKAFLAGVSICLALLMGIRVGVRVEHRVMRVMAPAWEASWDTSIGGPGRESSR